MFDILETIKAIYTQIEHYSKLELIYNNSNEKEKIINAIKEISCSQKYQMKISDNIVCIEFQEHNKESEQFIDNLTNLIIKI